jgi:hypothetical protein
MRPLANFNRLEGIVADNCFPVKAKEIESKPEPFVAGVIKRPLRRLVTFSPGFMFVVACVIVPQAQGRAFAAFVRVICNGQFVHFLTPSESFH